MPPKKGAATSKGEKRKRSPTPSVSDDELRNILEFLLKDAADEFALGKDAKQQSLFDLMKVSGEYTPFQYVCCALSWLQKGAADLPLMCSSSCPSSCRSLSHLVWALAHY